MPTESIGDYISIMTTVLLIATLMGIIGLFIINIYSQVDDTAPVVYRYERTANGISISIPSIDIRSYDKLYMVLSDGLLNRTCSIEYDLRNDVYRGCGNRIKDIVVSGDTIKIVLPATYTSSTPPIDYILQVSLESNIYNPITIYPDLRIQERHENIEICLTEECICYVDSRICVRAT